jgi:hypothetical protein
MVRLIFFSLCLFPVGGNAQTEVGIKGGLNISDIVMTNFINPDVESELDLKLGLHAGVFIRSLVDERLAMTAELLYSDKGVRANTNIHLHYVTIPMLVQYRLSDNVWVEMGPEPGYLFSARSDLGNVSNTYNNKFDLGLDAGILLDKNRVMVALRYCVGLFSVRDPIETSGSSGIEKIKFQNRVLQVSVGYKLWSID